VRRDAELLAAAKRDSQRSGESLSLPQQILTRAEVCQALQAENDAPPAARDGWGF